MKLFSHYFVKTLYFSAMILTGKMVEANNNKTDIDIIALPDYCAPIIKRELMDKENIRRWEKFYSGFDGIHHYCYGLNAYNNALRTFDGADRKYLLKGAINEMSYPLHHHFNPKHPLSPKLFYDIGKASEALEDYKSAIGYYQSSIELNPNIWLPYAALSDLQVKLNLKNEAIETLKNGLKFKPNSKPLLKRLNKLQN